MSFLKINFDGFVANSKVVVGFIIRNEGGDPIAVGVRWLGENSIFVAKGLALRGALSMARSRGFKKKLSARRL